MSELWKIYLLILILSTALLIVADLGVWLMYGVRHTLTDWLRCNPVWWYWPASIAVGIVALVTLHLWFGPGR
jgi:hypothetical protein